MDINGQHTPKEVVLVASEGKKRILVIDDEPAVQELIRLILERWGFEMIQALDVASGVEVLRQKPLPDLVLLDLMLPDVDGLELLRQIRETKVFDNLPVIIVSALVDSDRIRKGLEMGADRYITKPAMSHNLLKTVQEVLKTGRRTTT
jgi:two-component system, OmpR family, alkaline phosphatase synthesis response regulator PhoP